LAEGLADPLDAHAKRPLAEHAEDFRRYLQAKGNTADYVDRTTFRLTALLDGCRFVLVGDVQPSAVLSFLVDLRVGGKGLKTANDYLAAVKGFTRWLWRDKRTALDPLAGMPRLAAKGDLDFRHARRDLEGEELRRLLERPQPHGRQSGAGLDRTDTISTCWPPPRASARPSWPACSPKRST
jgi:site-specific recombinase XerC